MGPRTMKKLMTKTGALTLSLIAVVGVLTVATAASATGSIVRAGATGATAGATGATGVTQQPVQNWAAKSGVYFYVDTIQGAGGKPAPAAGCAITNLFQTGQVVVFRMWGVNAKDGATLTDKTVKKAFVRIPQAGGTVLQIPLVYGAHGTVAYWTAPWNTTASTPIGVVNFTVTVTTMPVKKTNTHPKIPALTGKFSQAGLPSVSNLTITPA
jgi:hypothetical protein